MVVTNISKFDQQRITLVKYKIKEVRKAVTDKMLDESVNFWLRGYRFNNTDRVIQILLGKIFSECKMDEKEANKKFVSLNSTETEPYIKTALFEAARGDYHYTHEKNYD